MTLLERLEEQRNQILEKLGKVDKRIVRNGGKSLFEATKPGEKKE